MKERERSPRFATLHRHALELRSEYVVCNDYHERQTIRNELDVVDCQIAQAERQVENLARLPDFWDDIYGSVTGYVALFSGWRGPKRLERPQEAYFPYPHATAAAVLWVKEQIEQEREAYQCAHLVTDRRRLKQTAAPIASLWVDLDHDVINHETVPLPTVQVQSSPGKLQAYWRLTKPIDRITAEHYNRQLAQHLGADQSGWDATQLLRVVGTVNHKYADHPLVTLLAHVGPVYDLAELADQPTRPPLFNLTSPVPRGLVPEPPLRRQGVPALTLAHLPLTATARRIVHGELPKRRPDGEVDRSGSLVQIARVLYGAGVPVEKIPSILAERDEMLGWRKYADRADAVQQYVRIIKLIAQ